MEKIDLMSLCREYSEVYDCGLCPYEFSDTCYLKQEEIKKELENMKENDFDDKETKQKTTPIHELINECIELLKISGDNTKAKVLNKLLDFKHRYLDE